MYATGCHRIFQAGAARRRAAMGAYRIAYGGMNFDRESGVLIFGFLDTTKPLKLSFY